MDLIDEIDEHIKAMELGIELEYKEELERNKELQDNFTIDDLELGGYAIKGFLIDQSESQTKLQTYKLTIPNAEINLVNNQLIKAGFVGITINEETKSNINALIIEVEPLSVTILCHQNLLQIDCKHFNMVKTINDVTFNRMNFALLQYRDSIPKKYLLGLLAGINPLRPHFSKLLPYSKGLSFFQTRKILWFNENLNNSQKEAIKFSLYQQDLAIINGPPGTGKTTTLVELILQLLTRGYRILVCGPSNVAVDNIFKSLIKSYQKMVKRYSINFNKFNFARIGNRIRIDKEIQPYAVEPEYNPKKKISSKKREKIIREKLLKANVIMGTLTSSSVFHGQLSCISNSSDLVNFEFDIVIIDECAQAMEPATLIPLISAKKCVLAGDHKQLPPTVFSLAADKLKISLFERLMNKFGNKVSRILTVQYRMNKIIMNWPSKYFYDSILNAHSSVANRYLVFNNKHQPAIRLINTAGCNMFENNFKDTIFETSKGNVHEANIICKIVLDLISMNLKMKDIGIIAPYRLQAIIITEMMRNLIKDRVKDLEISTVDSFQGREKEIIIFSMVRSNPNGSIGFLNENRRFNVAITRAKKMLIVVGDALTVSNSPALKDFIHYCLLNASVENACEMQIATQTIDLNKLLSPKKRRRTEKRRRRRNNNTFQNRN